MHIPCITAIQVARVKVKTRFEQGCSVDDINSAFNVLVEKNLVDFCPDHKENVIILDDDWIESRLPGALKH